MENNNSQYLIISRHGQQCNEHGLTQAGQEQVKALGETLSNAGFSPDSILASYPDRTQKSADILQQHFKIATRHIQDFLNTYKFDIDEFIESIPTNLQTVLIAAHEESIQCFGHYLLDDKDTVALFEILPASRKDEHELETGIILSCHAHHADALIITKDQKSATGWCLYGWIADGQLLLAESATPTTMTGEKYNALPEFPEILLELTQ